MTKKFGDNVALAGIDLEIGPGEFVGLVGPNGAGKSTLIKILDGVYTADGGSIDFKGAKIRDLCSHPGVAFIHQDLGLVDTLTIAENMRLGRPSVALFGPILNKGRERRMAADALSKVGLHSLSPDTLVGSLSPGEKTLVAVVRALAGGAELLVVDEATSTLPTGDANRVLSALQNVRDLGAGIIFVSHKFREVLGACDRVVVLIDGSIAADQAIEGLDEDGLTDLMFAAETGSKVTRAVTSPGEAVLLRMRAARSAQCGPIDLEVHAGEVVGLTGLPGSGMYELAEMAAGTMSPRRGKVELGDGARQALVPPNRESQGGFEELSSGVNLTISSLSRWTWGLGMVSTAREHRDAGAFLRQYEVSPSGADVRFGGLSGGNKQKVIFARTFLSGARVCVLCEPTRGVDVKTRRTIYRLIRQLRDEREAAVLVVSTDAEDLFAVSDRVGLVEAGAIRNLTDAASLSRSQIIEMV